MRRLLGSTILYAVMVLSFSTFAVPYSSPGAKRFKEFGNRTAYQILHVPELASHAECKSAYRKQAAKLLPGANAGNKTDEQDLAALNVAWNYLDGIEKERHLKELEEKEAAPAIDEAPFTDLFEDPVNANMAAQEFASKQAWTSSYYSAKQYTDKLGLRENQLMNLVDSLVNRREHKLIDQAAVDKVVHFFKSRYHQDIDSILTLIRNNLFRDLASELLVRAAAKYYLTECKPFGIGMVHILRDRIEYEKLARAETFITSKQSKAEFDLLLVLNYGLEEVFQEFGPQSKSFARRQSCESKLAN